MSTGRRFELIRTLGAGAYGTVYLADMVSTGGFRKKVALKLLKAQSEAALEQEAAQRLRDEARLLGRLRHRHIVQVDDLVKLDGQWAVVMEYVPGLDLEVLIKAMPAGERLSLRAVAEVIHQVAAALDAAWRGTDAEAESLRVIHRDIKPSNIRLTRTGDVKVLDFGIARVEMPEREAATGQFLMGTPNYIAPERLLGDLDAPSGDVYSLGGVLYELIIGKPLGRVALAPEKQRTQVQGALARVHDRVDLGPGVDGLLALLEEMLSYEPEARPAGAQVSARALALASELAGESLAVFSARVLPNLLQVAGQGGEATTGVLQEGPSPTLKVQPGPLPATTLMARPFSRPWKVWRVLGGGLVLALLVGWWLGRGEEPAVPVVVEAPARVEPAPAPAPAAASPPAAPLKTKAVEEPEPRPARAASAPPSQVETARPQAPKTMEPAPASGATAQTVAADARRLRALKFVQEGGREMRVTCGDVSGSGSASVLLRNAPAGACLVVVDGLRTQITVTQPRGVDCTLSDGALVCR